MSAYAKWEFHKREGGGYLIKLANIDTYPVAIVPKNLRPDADVRDTARLIAATHDLLAALQNICANAELGPDMGEAWHGTVDIYKVPLDDIEAARAAIAKATGGTP